jgi:hypothetical protein
MTAQYVTLDLPEVLGERTKRAANAPQRPWEEVIVSVLAAALPDVEDTLRVSMAVLDTRLCAAHP